MSRFWKSADPQFARARATILPPDLPLIKVSCGATLNTTSRAAKHAFREGASRHPPTPSSEGYPACEAIVPLHNPPPSHQNPPPSPRNGPGMGLEWSRNGPGIFVAAVHIFRYRFGIAFGNILALPRPASVKTIFMWHIATPTLHHHETHQIPSVENISTTKKR